MTQPAATFTPLYRVLRRWLPLLPGSLSGWVDWHLAPGLRGGEPFNGQMARRALFAELLAIFNPSAIVETGTFRGLTTRALREMSGVAVFTTELVPRHFYFAKHRLRHTDGVHLVRANSRRFLHQLVSDPRCPRARVLFYLDAHGDPDLPLREELNLVIAHWSDPLIVVDDFEVPGDSGYGYDDYGDGRVLAFDYLPPSMTSDFRLFSPAVRSEADTGSLRGCLVAVRRESFHGLDGAATLRPHAFNQP